jgi:hypothetical protein
MICFYDPVTVIFLYILNGLMSISLHLFEFLQKFNVGIIVIAMFISIIYFILGTPF